MKRYLLMNLGIAAAAAGVLCLGAFSAAIVLFGLIEMYGEPYARWLK